MLRAEDPGREWVVGWAGRSALEGIGVEDGRRSAFGLGSEPRARPAVTDGPGDPADASPSSRRERPEPDERAANAGDILLVEDEAWVRAAGAYFEGLGFRVRTATRASEALEAARHRPPDVLVVDIRLEGPGTGIDVARRMRADRPDLPVIVLTGLPDAELEGHREQLDGLPVLRKPLRLLELAEAVQKVLFERQARRD